MGLYRTTTLKRILKISSEGVAQGRRQWRNFGVYSCKIEELLDQLSGYQLLERDSVPLTYLVVCRLSNVPH